MYSTPVSTIGIFLLGLLIGIIVTLAFIYPRIGRILLRVISAIALSLCLALATWPTVSMIRKEPTLRAINLPLPNSSIAEVSEAFAWSAMMAVLGGLTLWFSFMGTLKKPAETITTPVRSEPTASDLPPPNNGVSG